MAKSRRNRKSLKKQKKTKSRKLKGGYKPPALSPQFSSPEQATQHALDQQQARGEYNAANNNMNGGGDVEVPQPSGMQGSGQHNLNKIVLANASAESLAKYDKVGGKRRRRKRRKTKAKKKQRKRRTKRKRRRGKK